AKPVRRARGAIEVAYELASVDGAGSGYGVAADADRAALIARCEALERFALGRDDLVPRIPGAARLPSLAKMPGLAFDFFRALAARPAQQSRSGPAALCVVRPVAGRGSPHSAPVDWVYFSPTQVANSNGAAFGKTVAAAVDGGRREIIERDLLLRG